MPELVVAERVLADIAAADEAWQRRKPAVIYCAHDDHWFLAQSINSFASAGPVYVYLSRQAWDGSEGNWQPCQEVAKKAGASVILCDFDNESDHRRFAFADAKERGFRWALIPDSDEIIRPYLLEGVLAMIQTGRFAQISVHMQTYWKSPAYRIWPPEQLTAMIAVDLEKVQHDSIRNYVGGAHCVLDRDQGLLDHLSYAGPDERIKRKISTWSHKHEVVNHWYQQVWQAWDTDRAMRNLHPTHPVAYGFAERIEIPDHLLDCWNEFPLHGDPPIPPNWPHISVIVPLHGGTEIDHCVAALLPMLQPDPELGGAASVTEALPSKWRGSKKKPGPIQARGFLHDVVVADDQSPDDAGERMAALAKKHPGMTVVRLPENLGFAGACNAGASAATGDVFLFLNSDTIPTRAAIIRLIETLMSSARVGASGPLSNEAGYFQRFEPTYSAPEGHGRFAQDFAWREGVEDRDVPMVVGLAFAIRRQTMAEIGPFDERFRPGYYEDNDYCHRLHRVGYSTRISARSFIYHEGAKTTSRGAEPIDVLMERNRQLIEEKWRDDLTYGFANQIAGYGPNLTVFNEARRPEKVRLEIATLAKRANITLCMIVKNEARCLRQMLESVRPFVTRMVVVDTGSTDGTQQIARDAGAEVFEKEWTNFGDCRNYSFSFAESEWIVWADADDILEWLSGEMMVRATLNAAPNIGAFLFDAVFLEGDGARSRASVHVPHPRLVRRGRWLGWTGKIHEQIMASVRAGGYEVVKLAGARFLHANYDTSPEGQQRKAEREDRLLREQLEDDPEHPYYLWCMGMTLHYRGRHAEAIEWLRKAIEFGNPNDSITHMTYTLLGLSTRELGDPEGALKIFADGLHECGEMPNLRFHTAMTLTSLGRLEEARLQYLQIDPATDPGLSGVDVSILGPKRSFNLAHICKALERYGETRQHLQDAINMGFGQAAISLFDLALEQGNLALAEQAHDAWGRLEGKGEPWAEALMRLSAARGIAPEQALLNAYNQDRIAPGPRLLLSKILQDRGQNEAARDFLMHASLANSPAAPFFLGMNALARLEYEEAIEAFDRSLALNPFHSLVQQKRGEAEQILREMEAKVLKGKGPIVGPHAGALGPARCGTSVIIVTFNSSGTITRCIDSLLPQLALDDEVIVVDNASTDATAEVVAAIVERDRRVHFLAQESNLGYARGANIGLSVGGGERLLLLNPDTVVAPEGIGNLASRLVDGVGAVGPVSNYIYGRQNVMHFLAPSHRPELRDLSKTMRLLHPGETRFTRFLAGVCLMLPRAVLDSIGLLDESTELGADDLELSWRLRLHGYRLAIAADVFVEHVGHASFATLPDTESRSRIEASDAALVRKLAAFYGKGRTPSSREIWGNELFADAMRTAKDF